MCGVELKMNSVLPDISIVKEEQDSIESDHAENEIGYQEGYHVLLSGENTNILKKERDAFDTGETIENIQPLPKPHEIKVERSDFTIKLEPAAFCESVYDQDIDNHFNPLKALPHYDTMIEFSQPSSSAIKLEREYPFSGECNEWNEVVLMNPEMKEYPRSHNFEYGKVIVFFYGNRWFKII